MLDIRPLVLTVSLTSPIEYHLPENKFSQDIPYPVKLQEKLPSTLDYQPTPLFDPSDILYKTIIKELEESGE